MDTKQVQNIQEALKSFIKVKGSQNKAATAIGYTSALLSDFLNGKKVPTDETLRIIASKIGLSRDTENTWQVAETKAYKTMTFCIEQAQDEALTMAVTGTAGIGKTEAIEVYCSEHKDAFHLCCSEYWNRRTFLMELLRGMGEDGTGASVTDLVDDVIDGLKRKSNPVIIMDEADKLSDSVLYFFISIYNRLEDRCGLMLVATDYLEKRIKKGLRNNRKGYQEIYSRLGRKFITLPKLDDEDIATVCAVNGMNDAKAVNRLLTETKNDNQPDLRRVKRAVWSWQKAQEKNMADAKPDTKKEVEDGQESAID